MHSLFIVYPIYVQLAKIVPLILVCLVLGATLQILVIILFGIHSTNDDEYLLPIFAIYSSTSLVYICEPLNKAEAVNILPYLKFPISLKTDLESNIIYVTSAAPTLKYLDVPKAIKGA